MYVRIVHYILNIVKPIKYAKKRYQSLLSYPYDFLVKYSFHKLKKER